jgi:hypothetical protein
VLLPFKAKRGTPDELPTASPVVPSDWMTLTLDATAPPKEGSVVPTPTLPALVFLMSVLLAAVAHWALAVEWQHSKNTRNAKAVAVRGVLLVIRLCILVLSFSVVG